MLSNQSLESAAMPTAMQILLPIAFTVLPNIGGVVNALLIRNQITNWYSKLKKPPWNPPNWVFGPVWTCLYTAMGVASWLVFNEVGLCSIPMYLYGAQLLLNWAWSPLFFCAHSLGLASLELGATLVLSVACTIEFHPVSPLACYLLLPYLAWLCLALSLNVYIWLYNDSSRPSAEVSPSEKKGLPPV